MVELIDSTEMTSQFSQLFWENLIVTVPAKDECSRDLWWKFLSKKPVTVLNILKGGNSLSLSISKRNEKQICIWFSVRCSLDLMIYYLLIYDK